MPVKRATTNAVEKTKRASTKAVAKTKRASTPKRKPSSPQVRMGHVAANGISASLYGLIDRGASKRPGVARSLRGAVELRFEEDFAPVRIDFRPDGVLVEDAGGEDGDWSPDLVIQGSLPDIVQLASAPLVGGLPKPTDPRGRAALARVAGGRVRIDGNPLLARRVLKLLEI